MARVRRLTIASMAGTVWLRFRDIANNDMQFSAIAGGHLHVHRDNSGTTYTVATNTDHIRVFVDIVGPSDMPNVFYWDGGDTYGWWELEGYERKEFGSRFKDQVDNLDANYLAQQELGKPEQVLST